MKTSAELVQIDYLNLPVKNLPVAPVDWASGK